MFALVAALFFLLALIFALAGLSVGGVLTVTTLGLAGLLAVALHLMGVGAGWNVLKK
ncbi:hypothetical protein [Nonomuraea sp. 3-1Str]|uniref:hypothetical protein n=1 Tax=unclassified Nonomuraea TaxID=2593643 RepID=UPI0028613952|nr:hypothetical protein [Nonomuraea sp. 3-1Str]MDR8409360.1 hypothetical protein [Nonomuraea sp. 3-1Str]